MAFSRDVADHAGVSISTVSHAFNGARPISEPTRLRVRRAAEELGYRPDPRGQSLRTAKTGIIGLILRPRDAIAGSARGTETFERLIGPPPPTPWRPTTPWSSSPTCWTRRTARSRWTGASSPTHTGTTPS